jgi:hypothetical protein
MGASQQHRLTVTLTLTVRVIERVAVVTSEKMVIAAVEKSGCQPLKPLPSNGS